MGMEVFSYLNAKLDDPSIFTTKAELKQKFLSVI